MTRRTVPAYLTTGLSSLVELVAITDELKQQVCVWICDCVHVCVGVQFIDLSYRQVLI